MEDNNPRKTLHHIVGFSCNNNCIFCMESRTYRNRIERLTLEEHIELLKRSKKFDRVVFTTGEPTLNPLLPEIVSASRSLGFKERVLITNGRMLSYMGNLKRLIDAGVNEIGVSIHGHTKELHDSLTRTPGSFEQTVKALENMRRVKLDFTAHVTVTKLNYKHLDDIYRFVIGFSPDTIVFNMFNPIDKAKKHIDLMPKYSEIAPYLKKWDRVDLVDFPACIAPTLNHSRIEDYHIRQKKGFDRNSTRGKIFLKKCGRCVHRCQGIPKMYVDRYGTDEFKLTPLPEPAE